MKQPSLVILLTLAASATAYTCQDYGNPDNAMGYDCSSRSRPGVLQFCADCHCQTYNECRKAESIIEPTRVARIEPTYTESTYIEPTRVASIEPTYTEPIYIEPTHVDQIAIPACSFCTAYSFGRDVTDLEHKQDYDGKCWSTNEAGGIASNGLEHCTACVDDDGWEDSATYTVSAGFIHSFPRLASSCSALSC